MADVADPADFTALDPAIGRQYSERTERALLILQELVELQLEQTRREADHALRHERVLDCEMLVEVARPAGRAYASIMQRIFEAVMQGKASRFVLTEATRGEIEEFVRWEITQLHRARGAVRQLTTYRRHFASTGVFTQSDWGWIREQIELAADTSDTLRVMGELLERACAAFSKLEVGEESHWVDRGDVRRLTQALEQWSTENQVERTASADGVDATNVSAIKSLNKASERLQLWVSMVTATKPVREVATAHGVTALENPLQVYLDLRVKAMFPDLLGRVRFLHACKVELARLCAGFDNVKYASSRGGDIQRQEVRELVGLLKGVLHGGNLSLLRRMLTSAASGSTSVWHTLPKKERTVVEMCSLDGLTSAISRAHRLLAHLVSPEHEDVLQVVGGYWEETVNLPTGTKSQLVCGAPTSSICLEAFEAGYYSIYWDTDASVLEFLDLVKEVTREQGLQPERLTAITSGGDELECRYAEDSAPEDTMGLFAQGNISLLVVESRDVDIFFRPPKAQAISPELLKSTCEAQIAVLSRVLATDLCGSLCAHTFIGSLTADEFQQLFAEKIRKVFEGVRA